MATDAAMREFSRLASMIEINEDRRKEVISKSNELHRLSTIKMPTNNKTERAKVMVLLELSCRLLKVSFSTQKLRQMSKDNGISSSEFQKALATFKNVLNLKIDQTTSTLDVLSLRFDHFLKSEATKILEKYRVEYVSQLPLKRAEVIDLSSPLYEAVAFALAAKEKNIKIDKKAIVEAGDLETKAFKMLFDEMSEVS